MPGFPNLPFPNPTDPFGLVSGASDLLNPDEKAKLSAVLSRNGWGSPNGALNRMARTVVQRESNGDPNAENPSGATGLFQMMTPLHCGSYGIPRATGDCKEWLKDPDNNAKAAHALFRANGWEPWKSSGPIPPPPTNWDTTVTTDKDTIVGGAGEVAADVASPFVAVGKAATDLIGTLLSADTWFRIGKGWLGFVLLTTGTGALVFIVANKASGGTASKVAKAAVTKGVIK